MGGLITLLPESKIENYDQTDEITIGLQSSTSAKKNQKITLVMGSDDNAVITSVLTFQENINSSIIVNKKDSILASDSNDILVIFSHGTEKGMIINDELISWAKLSILLSQTNAKLILLATCFGANIYNYTENTDKKIIGWSGVSDAIMIGYVIALIVNTKFQYLDNAQANFNLLIDRYYQISDHPEQIIPLVYSKIELRNTYGWFGIVLVSSVVLNIKFTPSEVSTLSNLNIFLSVLLTILGMISAINPVFLGVIVLQIINIFAALTTSVSHHPSGGGWISFEFFGLPLIGSYIHGYAPSGSAVYTFLFWPDIFMGFTMYLIYLPLLHNWRWLSI